MIKDPQHITVFEYESIRFDKGEKRITEDQFKALQNYYGDGVPYYTLRYNGVRFNEYVGVIQIGKTLIEVLPKVDKNESDDKKWRKILIGMIKTVSGFNVKTTSDSNLKIKPNTILELYFEMFIKEVEYLLHNGLLKKYRKKEGNVNALKGSLQFGKHIQQNLIHQERFFVSYTTYDVRHMLHFIIRKTILLLQQINTNSKLHGRIGALLLNFPEMPEMKISESTFDKLIFTRKTQSYKKAIEIAKLIILRYHPDISKGRNNVLALMFNMNMLWEKFIYVTLRKNLKNFRVDEKLRRKFWRNDGNRSRSLEPDIVITNDSNSCFVLDTKWKNIETNPSIEDLRQLYAYNNFFKADKVALVYPGEFSIIEGFFLEQLDEKKTQECSVIKLDVDFDDLKSGIGKWQRKITNQIYDKWINLQQNEEVQTNKIEN